MRLWRSVGVWNVDVRERTATGRSVVNSVKPFDVVALSSETSRSVEASCGPFINKTMQTRVSGRAGAGGGDFPNEHHTARGKYPYSAPSLNAVSMLRALNHSTL
jgi:hypothetical protein